MTTKLVDVTSSSKDSSTLANGNIHPQGGLVQSGSNSLVNVDSDKKTETVRTDEASVLNSGAVKTADSGTADLLGLNSEPAPGAPPPTPSSGASINQTNNSGTHPGAPTNSDPPKNVKAVTSKKPETSRKSALPKPNGDSSKSPKRSASSASRLSRPLSVSVDVTKKPSNKQQRPVSASMEGSIPKPRSPKMTPTPRATTAPISRQKSETEKVQSKCGSKDNIKHTPGGGNVKIESKKLEFKERAKSKIGSLDNSTHTPRGGEKKIENRKLEWKAESRVGSLQNSTHKPKGGDKKIENRKLNWEAKSKVGSLDNTVHVAGGGTKKIETHKLDFKEKASSKVGSRDNITHKAGGGDKKIESQKLTFKENAKPKTDAGTARLSTDGTGTPSPHGSRSGSTSAAEGEITATNETKLSDTKLAVESNPVTQ